MFQRLKMPHTLDGGGDGFLVKYASLAESDIKAESVLYLSCQYLCLHFAHQPNLQFLQFFRPNGTQRRVFLGKFEQFRVKQPRRAIVRQNHFVRQNGFEQWCFSVLFRSESLSRISRRKPDNGAYIARIGFVCLCEIVPRIKPYLRRFFFSAVVFYRIANVQRAACYLHICKSDIAVMRNFEHPCAEDIRRVFGTRGKCHKRVQKFFNAVCRSRRAEKNGYQFSLRRKPRQFSGVRCSVRGELFKQFFRKKRKPFRSCFVAFAREKRSCRISEIFAYVLSHRRFARKRQVGFVDKNKSGNAVFVKQFCQRSRMRLNAVRCAYKQHRAVQHLQNTLRLRRKIDVSRRVRKNYFRVAYLKPRFFRIYRYSPFALNLVRVQKCVTVVNAPAFAQLSRRIQKRFRKRRFSGIDVRKYSDDKFTFHSSHSVCFVIVSV